MPFPHHLQFGRSESHRITMPPYLWYAHVHQTRLWWCRTRVHNHCLVIVQNHLCLYGSYITYRTYYIIRATGHSSGGQAGVGRSGAWIDEILSRICKPWTGWWDEDAQAARRISNVPRSGHHPAVSRGHAIRSILRSIAMVIPALDVTPSCDSLL